MTDGIAAPPTVHFGELIVDTTRINHTLLCSKIDHGAGSDLYLISMAARMLGMHPQTLRKFTMAGAVHRADARQHARHTRDELERLRLIKRLVDELRDSPASTTALGRGGRGTIAPLLETRPSRADARQRPARELEALNRFWGVAGTAITRRSVWPRRPRTRS
jgi:hypothetical protein